MAYMWRISFLSGIIAFVLLLAPASVSAGWVSGHWRNGQYVNGYWRSDPNGLKYDNYSFDGDWSNAYNDSYYSPTKNYSSDWYTPTWITQEDYYIGQSFYDTKSSYKSYDYSLFDYDYDFRTDPIYKYTPSYNYGYRADDLFDSGVNSYSSSYKSLSDYGSSYLKPYSSSSLYNSYTPYSSYSSPYSSHGSSLYNNTYLDDYSSDDCYTLYC